MGGDPDPSACLNNVGGGHKPRCRTMFESSFANMLDKDVDEDYLHRVRAANTPHCRHPPENSSVPKHPARAATPEAPAGLPNTAADWNRFTSPLDQYVGEFPDPPQEHELFPMPELNVNGARRDSHRRGNSNSSVGGNGNGNSNNVESLWKETMHDISNAAAVTMKTLQSAIQQTKLALSHHNIHILQPMGCIPQPMGCVSIPVDNFNNKSKAYRRRISKNGLLMSPTAKAKNDKSMAKTMRSPSKTELTKCMHNAFKKVVLCSADLLEEGSLLSGLGETLPPDGLQEGLIVVVVAVAVVAGGSRQ
eukprot:jgi/Psemu1/30751/gm1.30751_g